MKKRIFRKSRHLEWNWEQSPDSRTRVRYHFIVIDDKDRENTINKLIQQLCEWGGAIERVRSIEGKVEMSQFRYLFESYDSDQKPSMLNLPKLNKPVKRDRDLYERKSGSEGIENYVRDRFEKIS